MGTYNNQLRQSQRYPTSIAAAVIAERRHYPVQIKDISTLGCCLSGPVDVVKGDEVVVLLGEMSVVATIAWVRGDLKGATFHKAIDPLHVVRQHSDHPMFVRLRSANSMIAIA